MFQALLVSKDDEAADIFIRVLSGFDVSVSSCGYTDAERQLSEERRDAVVVDFEETEAGAEVLRRVCESSSGKRAVTVALLTDKTQVRSVIGQGANFIVYKPVSSQQVETTLRAAISLMRRERRRSTRVPLQVPVQVRADGGAEIEAILLDLSEDGMDILAAQPLSVSSAIGARFALPDDPTELEANGEVAWANPNGQAGVRLMDAPETLRNRLRDWVAANAPELPPQDPDPVMPCKLTDLSVGGCYVETESPFPEGSGVTLALKAEGVETQAVGRVRVMHPGFGMGIEFAARTPEQCEAVANFIEFLTSRPGTTPDLSITPRALTAGETYDEPSATEEAEPDPLLLLLRRHESLSQEEFLQELHLQRSSEPAASA